MKNFVLLATCILVFAGSCKKDTTTAPVAKVCNTDMHATYFKNHYQNNFKSVSFSSTTTSSDIASYLWNFGDGNTSTSLSPSHDYTADGNYAVKFRAVTSCGDSVKIDTTVVICSTCFTYRYNVDTLSYNCYNQQVYVSNTLNAGHTDNVSLTFITDNTIKIEDDYSDFSQTRVFELQFGPGNLTSYGLPVAGSYPAQSDKSGAILTYVSTASSFSGYVTAQGGVTITRSDSILTATFNNYITDGNTTVGTSPGFVQITRYKYYD